MKITKCYIIIASLCFLTHCATYDFSKPTVQQGNLLPGSTINRLHIGMSKNDVAILMGTSLLNPPFTNNRWDYAYTLRKRGGFVDKRNLTLYFKNDHLTAIQKH